VAKINKKRVVLTALIGGVIFSGVVLAFDYFLSRPFSWTRLGFYFVFSFILYGFLTYRNLKKQKK